MSGRLDCRLMLRAYGSHFGGGLITEVPLGRFLPDLGWATPEGVAHFLVVWFSRSIVAGVAGEKPVIDIHDEATEHKPDVVAMFGRIGDMRIEPTFA